MSEEITDHETTRPSGGEVLPQSLGRPTSTDDGNAGHQDDGVQDDAGGTRLQREHLAAIGVDLPLPEAPSTPRRDLFRTATTVEHVIALSQWLMSLAQRIEQPAVAIGVNDRQLSFAVPEEVVVTLDFERMDTQMRMVAVGLIRDVLTNPAGPLWYTRAGSMTVSRLSQLVGPFSPEGTDVFISHIRDDYSDLCYAQGVTVPAFPAAYFEALDTAVLTPQRRIEAPRIYTEVLLPLAKDGMKDRVVGEKETTHCRVVYKDLFLRLIAHYSREPLLIRIFRELPERKMAAVLAEVLDIEADDVLPFMQYLMMCPTAGTDADLPPWFVTDPAKAADYRAWKHTKADKILPVVRVWSAEADYTHRNSPRSAMRGLARTIYGRYLPTDNPAQLLFNILSQSCEDIVSVFNASLLNWGATNLMTIINNFGFLNRADCVTFTSREDTDILMDELAVLAALADPLIVPLQPEVDVRLP